MQQPFHREDQLNCTGPENAQERVELLLWPNRTAPSSSPSCPGAEVSGRRIRDITVADVAISAACGPTVAVASGILDSCYAIVIPISGSAMIGCAGQEIHIASGLAAVAGPADPLSIRWASGTTLRVVRIEQGALESQVSAMDSRPRWNPPEIDRAMDIGKGSGRIFAEEVARMVVLLERDVNSFAQPAAAAATEQIIMARLLEASGDAYGSDLPDRGGTTRPPTVVEAVDLIEDHPEWDHTVDSLADEVGTSRRSLERAFRKHMGMSPWKYVKAVRLRKARDQLRAADPHKLTVGEVARRCGMTHSQFSAEYQRIYGEAPVQTLQASPWPQISS